MTQVDYELRPMLSDKPIIVFGDREAALTWMDRRSRATGWNVPVRLVKVEKTVVETVEQL